MSGKMAWAMAAVGVLSLVAGCASVPAAAGAKSPVGATAVAPEGAERRPAIARRILLYLPNRVLDVTDVVSASVEIPFFPKRWLAGFLHVNAHATRGVQAGFGAANENIFLGKGYKRRFMPSTGEKHELSLGPLTFCKHKVSRGNEKTDFTKVGVLLPTDEPFTKGLMDYWAVGAEVTVLPIGLKAEAHPVEILDAVLGFFFIDVGKDDL